MTRPDPDSHPPRGDNRDAQLRQLAKASRAIRPWTDARRQHVLDELEERAGAAARRPPLAYLAAAAAAAVIVTVLALRGLPPRGSADTATWHAVAGGVEADRGSSVRSDTAERLVIKSGHLRGEQASLVMITPFMQVTVAGARFELTIDETVATLILDEGTAELRSSSGGARVALQGPARLSSNDARLTDVVAPAAHAAPSPRPQSARVAERAAPAMQIDALAELRVPASPACDEGSEENQRGCLEREASGHGLAAQNALVALGLLESRRGGGAGRGLERFREYQRRFPSGLLGPEAASGVLRELIAAGRFAEAEEAAGDFLRRFPSDARTAATHLTRARLLQYHLGAPARAEVTYRAALTAGLPPPLADDATFELGQCAQDLGLADEARAAWQRYLDRYPGGRHAGDAGRLLRR